MSVLPFLVAAAVLLFFLGLNLICYRVLTRAHPRAAALIRALFIAGNLFWLALPLLFFMGGSQLMIVLRSFLGPPWFSWLIFLLLYSSFLLFVGMARLISGSERKFAEFARRPSAVFLLALALAVVAGYYSALVPLRTPVKRVQLEGLPAELDGVRVALLSDLHVGLFTRPSRLERISRAVNGLDPDIVLVAGDFVDDASHFVPKFVKGMSAVEPDTPVFAVLGNHEIYGDPERVVSRMRAQSRVELLVNETALVRKGNATLAIVGISDPAAEGRWAPESLRPDLNRALEGVPAGAFPILLAHQPKSFEEAAAARVPLTLTGHSHGGQFGIRALDWSLAGVFIPYHMGLYAKAGSQLFVTTGAGYWVVPFRLGMSPEVVLIELASAP